MTKKILLTLSVAAAFFAGCNSNPSANNAKPLVVATDSAAAKYQCPMKCQGDTAYTTEGKCPVCEMDLVKL